MKYPNNNCGFTILEVAASLAIVSIGMVGVLSLVIQIVQVENMDRNRIIASQLAQEGVEVIRNKRDLNWLNGDPWDSGLTDGTYLVDYTGKIISPPPGSDARLYINNDGFYDYNVTGDSTSFYRIVEIEKEAPGDPYFLVKSIIEWRDRGNTERYVIDTALYNWR